MGQQSACSSLAGVLQCFGLNAPLLAFQIIMHGEMWASLPTLEPLLSLSLSLFFAAQGAGHWAGIDLLGAMMCQ